MLTINALGRVARVPPGTFPDRPPPARRVGRADPRPAPGTLRMIPEDPNATIDRVFQGRVRRTPEAIAYIHYDSPQGRWQDISWGAMAWKVARWQAALAGLGLYPGERVALMVPNGPDWVAFDQAALGLGLVTVPLYPNDRPDNLDWVLRDSGARVLLIAGASQWDTLAPIAGTLSGLRALISLEEIPTGPPNLRLARDWLPPRGGTPAVGRHRADDLATLVYTSGTTGRPKGVMLSHRNILANVWAGLAAVEVKPEDRFLSFLPLSHMLERTIGYYVPLVAGCGVAFARSIADLPEDLLRVRPTILVAVPRVFERFQARVQETLAKAPRSRQRLFALALAQGARRFLHAQGRAPWAPGLLLQPLLDRLAGAQVRARLGGRLRFTVCGGAPLPPAVARFFLALGVEILQGYGLTETSPVIAVNRREDNLPDTVGQPLSGIAVRLGRDDELLTRGPSVSLGYWHNPSATRALIDAEGWLHTGDQARIGPRGHITITGRLKEILVLSTGEKVPPADLERALAGSPLVEQALVVGDGRPFLSRSDIFKRLEATYF